MAVAVAEAVAVLVDELEVCASADASSFICSMSCDKGKRTKPRM
jgi:hypothetical protein